MSDGKTLAQEIADERDEARAEVQRLREILKEHANVGDRVNHAWAFICAYCGKCSDERLEHNPDCILASRPKLDSAPGPVLDSGRGK